MSAALALGDVIVAALEADAPTQAFLEGTPDDPAVYSGRAPDPNRERYIVLGYSREREGGGGHTFGSTGYANTERLHLWTKGSAKRPVVELYKLVQSALSAVSIPLDGHTLLRLRTELVDTLVDQDGLYHHGIVDVSAHTRRA